MEDLIREGKIILSRVMKRIRENGLALSDKAGHYVIPSDYDGPDQALFWIPTKGCSYALSESGGCTMCNFGGAVEEKSEDELVKEFVSQLDHPDLKNSSIVNFGGQGSFFDDNEFSPGLRERLLDEVAKRKRIEVFVCESRPEFITREKFKIFREKLGRRFLELGIGIESLNPLVREGIVNKDFDEKAFDGLLKYSREFEIWLSLHLALKPNVLTEREAIEDAVNTIQGLLKNVDETHPTFRIILMVMNIKPDTLIEWAYKKGLYKLPSLWSCVEVLKRLNEWERGFVKILGFDTGVEPLKYAGNEDGTDKYLIPALKQFSRDGEIKPLLELEKRFSDSPSYKEWKKEMELPSENLRKRIKEFYDVLSKDFLEA